MDPNQIDRRSVEDAAREASERPLDFDPAERARTLRAMVHDLVPLVRQGKLEAELKGLPPYSIDGSWLTWHQPDSHVLEVNHDELWRVGCEQSSRQAVQRWIV